MKITFLHLLWMPKQNKKIIDGMNEAPYKLELNVSKEETNAKRIPGCSVIGVPERAHTTLSELVMHTTGRPWAAGEMHFYKINGLI